MERLGIGKSKRKFPFKFTFGSKQRRNARLQAHGAPAGERKSVILRARLVLIALLLALCSCSGGSSSQPQPSPPPADPCATLPPATALDFKPRLQVFLDNFCYQKQNWQHDANVRSSDGVHLFVQIWYSPSLMDWINHNRVGAPPDGAILVKEEHSKIDAPLLLWSLMIKDSNLSWDGWYWAVLFPTKSGQSSLTGACAEPQQLLTGAGLYCLNCHASAINNQGTFASTAYMAPMSSHGFATPGAIDGHVAQVLGTQAGDSPRWAPPAGCRVPCLPMQNPLRPRRSPAWSRSRSTMQLRPAPRRVVRTSSSPRTSAPDATMRVERWQD